MIIGDSLEDVRTGREGGASVIGVASGTTSPTQDDARSLSRLLSDSAATASRTNQAKCSSGNHSRMSGGSRNC